MGITRSYHRQAMQSMSGLCVSLDHNCNFAMLPACVMSRGDLPATGTDDIPLTWHFTTYIYYRLSVLRLREVWSAQK